MVGPRFINSGSVLTRSEQRLFVSTHRRAFSLPSLEYPMIHNQTSLLALCRRGPPSTRLPCQKAEKAGNLSTSRSEHCKGTPSLTRNDFHQPLPSVSFSPILMHRSKDLWGPDGRCLYGYTPSQVVTTYPPADEFDPDRFIDDRVKRYLVPNPFIFLPFSAGPRICIGQQV